MGKNKVGSGFPAINFIPDQERVRGGRPRVRPPLWIVLAVLTVILVAIMAVQLVPLLLVPR